MLQVTSLQIQMMLLFILNVVFASLSFIQRVDNQLTLHKYN